MKRFPLTLPQLGSTYPYSIDGHLELFTVDRIDLGQGLMYLSSAERSFERPTFINDVVRMVRPNNIEAWLPVLREHYTMDDEGRAALIAEATAPRTVAEDLAWVDSLEYGPYTPMGPVYHNGEDLARAFPQVPNDDYAEAFQRTHGRDLYATIGDPVPPLVWPRQESEQGPARSEVEPLHTDSGRVLVRVPDGCTWAYAPEALALENACSKVTKEPAPVDDAAPAKPHASFGPRCFSPEALDLMTVAQRPLKPGDNVRVARKVVTDSKGRDCDWDDLNMAQTIGTELVVSHVESVGDRDSIPVRLANGYWYSPEALDLIEPAP